jgi:hypothetical protein
MPTSPVLVFVPGLGENASFFWTNGNTMYSAAFAAGYRTAFISFSEDNGPANGRISDNASVLKSLLPYIAARYSVAKMYLVGHSKGGVDIEAALEPNIQSMVKAVFTLATPSGGTELADWAFGPGQELAQQLGLLTPAFFDMRTDRMSAFRQQVDPILLNAGIPFYSFAGTSYSGDPTLSITGPILSSLTSGAENDGIVTVDRTQLPRGYSMYMGKKSDNHYEMGTGAASFPIIDGQVRALELEQGDFERIATNGFGDTYNTWAWSMAWFQGKLYVGTARQEYCVETATALVQFGKPVYPPPDIGDCTPDYHDLHLRAEIWQFTPDTEVWTRVYQSPVDVPYTASDGSIKYQAHDFGYRGMQVFTEPDGTESLYVAAVSTSEILDQDPIYKTRPFPPPRMLRTTDGTTWGEVPHDPGTFLGDILVNNTDIKAVGYRQFAVYKGMLFVTATDLRGQGYIIASSTPAVGNDAWQRVSPDFNTLPVWAITPFNNDLYVGTGVRKDPDPGVGYGLSKTDASTPPPYIYTPIIEHGGYQTNPDLLSDNVLNMTVHNDHLYMGTDHNPELVRVDTNDQWEIVIGAPRSTTPQGPKYPVTGIREAFDNYFNVHFWELGVDGKNRLYFGTLDEGQDLYLIPPVTTNLNHDFGLDLYRSDDGDHWTVITKNGFGDGWNYGARTMLSTPIGFVFGTARPEGGCQIWLDRTAPARAGRAVRGAQNPDASPVAPTNLHAAPGALGTGNPVTLTWDASSGAVGYRVYRWTQAPILDMIKPGLVDPNATCAAPYPNQFLCNFGLDTTWSGILQKLTYLQNPELIALVAGTTFQDSAPTNLQSLYFVRAEDAQGVLSDPSNTVGGPSVSDR